MRSNPVARLSRKSVTSAECSLMLDKEKEELERREK